MRPANHLPTSNDQNNQQAPQKNYSEAVSWTLNTIVIPTAIAYQTGNLNSFWDVGALVFVGAVGKGVGMGAKWVAGHTCFPCIPEAPTGWTNTIFNGLTTGAITAANAYLAWNMDVTGQGYYLVNKATAFVVEKAVEGGVLEIAGEKIAERITLGFAKKNNRDYQKLNEEKQDQEMNDLEGQTQRTSVTKS